MKRKHADCGICALAIAAQIPYERAEKILAPHRIKRGILNYSKYKCTPLIRALKELKFSVKKTKNQEKTLGKLSKTLKKDKTFLVFTGGPKRGVNHVSIWKWGEMEDWAKTSKRRVVSIYEVRDQ